MTTIKFLYKDQYGHTTATSEATFADESTAIWAARLNLSERDYDAVAIWADDRLLTTLRRHDLAHAA